MLRKHSYGAEALCEICWENIATSKCPRCGRHVCKDHVGFEGICALCSSLMCSICGENLAVASCISCGRIACYRCLDRRYNELICMLCRIRSPTKIWS